MYVTRTLERHDNGYEFVYYIQTTGEIVGHVTITLFGHYEVELSNGDKTWVRTFHAAETLVRLWNDTLSASLEQL